MVNGLEIMRKAVAREIKRKKALSQYMIVFRDGEVKRIDFNRFPDESGNQRHKGETVSQQIL